ncbi:MULTISPECIES: DUF4345 domain-containing protein [unclassified Nocardioides]|uniref:DUF4345 domain-containing protein n=1 Tax=unclassified Nocardioides TaxID=2615069 RepID=UPI00191087A8|nr:MULTISPECIES: DUF4345 domain-containing protein [unclassified Nocardioides]
MSLRANKSTSRRRLQWTLAVLAAIPFASAGREVALGPAGVPGGSPAVNPTVDSALRYANVYKAAVAPVIWSQLGRVERSAGVTFALSSLFVGGLARLRSWQQTGRPHPVTVGAVVLELAAPPLLVVWQQRIRARSGTSSQGELS